MLKIKDYINLNVLKELGFEARYNRYSGRVEEYVKNEHVTVSAASRKIEAIWCCGEMDEEDYGEAIYDLTEAGYVEKIKEDKR